MGVPEGPEGGTRTPRRVRSGEERHSFSILGNAPEKFLNHVFSAFLQAEIVSSAVSASFRLGTIIATYMDLVRYSKC